jgi:hypothetical protein
MRLAVVVIQIKSKKESEMENLRTQRIAARVIPEEKKALLAIAQQERLKPSDALRLIIREAAKARGLWIERELHAWER